MIITCPNCNKKFNIDHSLIPESGRLLQCSNCLHKWHYITNKTQYTPKEKFQLTKEISQNKSEEININPPQVFQPIKKKNPKKEIKKPKIFKKNKKHKIQKREQKGKPVGIFNKIVILFISLTALLIILDTFKNELSIYITFLNPMFDSLYAVVTDINLFIKDLIR